jgi:signal transduction histidine kinase
VVTPQTTVGGPTARVAAWLARPHGRLGIRWIDVAATLVVIGLIEIDVVTGYGPGASRLDWQAYLLGAVLALPIVLRRKWPPGVLIACSVLLFLYYTFDRRNISPAPLLALPTYDAAVAGFMVAAIAIPAAYMTIGLFVVDLTTHMGLVALASEFLPSIGVLGTAIALGALVRSRRALAVETASRLRLAEEERDAEAARRVAEERLRIARELHDTVAHSMATITVQAGSALHLLGPGPRPAADGATGQHIENNLRQALTAIRETSKAALTEMRGTLGQLRRGAQDETADQRTGGLDRLPALCAAVTSAGAPVTCHTEGQPQPLPPAVDHAAYRILQESLTNVLRHAGPDAQVCVALRYADGALAIRVTDDGTGPPAEAGLAGAGSGHGLTGMAERAAAVGGEFHAGAGPAGGFEVVARLPVTAPASVPAS